MRAAILAGLVYSGTIFLFAFAMGVLRTLVVAPRIGEVAAVLVELPVVLGASWLVCRWAQARFNLASRLKHGAVMGAVAFVALQATEAFVALALFGRPPGDYLGAFAGPAGAMGLAGQILFALFPLIRSRR